MRWLLSNVEDRMIVSDASLFTEEIFSENSSYIEIS